MADAPQQPKKDSTPNEKGQLPPPTTGNPVHNSGKNKIEVPLPTTENTMHYSRGSGEK